MTINGVELSAKNGVLYIGNDDNAAVSASAADYIARKIGFLCAEQLVKCLEFGAGRGTMTSSHGSVHFLSRTGEVICYESNSSGDGNELSDIVRVDVIEWKLRYPGDNIAAEHDILDFGYWTRDGSYEPPEEDFRGDIEWDAT